MKRVLLTVHKFFPEHRAGTEVLTLKVAQELMRRGYETLVVTANPPDLDARHAVGPEISDFKYEGVDVHVIGEPMRLRNYQFSNEYHHPEVAAHFAEILRKFQPDLLHIFHCQNLSAQIVSEARKVNLPIVASLTDFWFVCPVVQLKRPSGELCRGPKAMASNCLTCYTPALFPPQSEIAEALERKLPALSKVLRALPRPLQVGTINLAASAYVATKLPEAVRATVQRPAYLRSAANSIDAIMVPTQLMADVFIENGVRPDIISKVHFGLDTAPLEPYQKKSESAEIRVGFIGTIFEHKGLDLLVSAFQKLPPAAPIVLKIYGDMEQFPDYSAKIRQLLNSGPNKNKIQFCGTFPNSELGSILQNLDILSVPSRWYENTPLVIQSAFATKTPVLGTDLGGISELVKHNINGLLFPLNDADALRKQLLRLLDENNLLPTLCRQIAPERTVQEMVDDIERVYETVLMRRSAKTDAHSNTNGPAMVS